MIIKNEELLLGQCLKSIRPVADEIIVVDTGSTDNSLNIAKRYGARIINYKWDGNLGKARNIYIANARHNWILTLDADETLAKKDLHKLKKLTGDKRILGYIFPIRNYTRSYDLLRNWHPNDGKYPDEERLSKCPGYSLTEKVRLFQKRKEIYYYQGCAAHTDFLEPLMQKKYANRIKNSAIPIHHFQYLKGAEAFISKKQKERLKDEIRFSKIRLDSALNCLNMGITFFNIKKDSKAILYLKKAAQIDPKYDAAYFMLGVVYKENELFRQAIFNLKKALELNPGYAEALIVLGMIYDEQKKYSLAETSLKKAMALSPNHPLAHNSLGIVYQNTGFFKKAETEYKKAIKINPFLSYAYYNLAGLYKTAGKSKEADKYYGLAVKNKD